MGQRIIIRRRLMTSALLAMALQGCEGAPGEPGAFPVNARNISSGDQPAERGFVADASATLGPKAGETTRSSTDDSPKATTGRKIVYSATINLVTEDLNKFEAGVLKAVASQKAYVADSERSGTAGATRHGTWKVRVPADNYEAFVGLVQKLGELVSIKADSQDVSEEYYDLDARQNAKKVEEARLLKHLSDSTGKLDEILAVERELSRVRGEIERMQGRLRVLADLTTLATVTIIANEIKDYIPPQAPTLTTKIGRTFALSVETLRKVGEGLLLLIVALIPWLPFILIAIGIIVWFSRKPVRRSPIAVPDIPKGNNMS